MIAKAILFLAGYQIDPSVHECLTRQRVGIFPHTSRVEVCICALAMWAVNIRGKVCFAVAHQYIDTPILGCILTYFGGFPVKKGTGTTQTTIEFLRAHPERSLAISPEGALRPKEWQTGFFYIARELQLPVVVVGIDFATHTILCRIQEEIWIGKEETPDDKMEIIRATFANSGIIPLFPEGSNPPIVGSEGTRPWVLPLRGKCLVSLLILVPCWLFFVFKCEL